MEVPPIGSGRRVARLIHLIGAPRIGRLIEEQALVG
jgi:hypothetical protein